MKKKYTIFLTLIAGFLIFPNISFAVGRVSVSTISNNTTEAGDTATFTITLDEPIICADPEVSCNVTIPISSSDTNEGTVSSSEIVFADIEWTQTKTVTVTGVSDDFDDGDAAFTVILGALTSASEYYNNYNPADVNVTNEDTDTADILTETTIDDTSESGDTGEVEVVLNSEPTANVVVGVYSGDTTEGTVSPEQLTFTPENWDEPQFITVIGVDDFIDDGLIQYDILFEPAVSEDDNYNGIEPLSTSMYTADDDTANITVVQTGTAVSESENATEEYRLSFILESEPTAPVTITVDSDEQIAFDVDQVTFEPEEWDVEKYVYVTAVDDTVLEEEMTSSITFTVSSEDALYDEFDIDSLSVFVISNDPAIIVNGQYIQVVLNGVVLDQKKVAKKKAKAQLYRLKTKKLYPKKAYTTVAYLRIKKQTVKLVVFRLTKQNILTKRAVAVTPIHAQEKPRLKLRVKHHRVIVSVVEGSETKEYRWKIGKHGQLIELPF